LNPKYVVKQGGFSRRIQPECNIAVIMKILRNSTRSFHPYNPAAVGAVALAACLNALQAQPISVSNYSFESQVVNPVIFPIDTRIDSWQKTPQPGWFVPSPQLTWDQTVGVFNGTLQNPYSNLVGNQAAYMLPIPTAGIFQDNLSVAWNGAIGGLSATYQPGFAYQFTLGVFGKSMIEGFSSMQLSLYYRDGANMVTVGTPTVITFSASTFNPAGPFALHDYTVTTPIVQAGDAWAGKNIGIKIESLMGDGNGYWDMDNVRLTQVVPEPTAMSLAAIGFGGLLFARVRARREA
jgi:hypothetical protein